MRYLGVVTGYLLPIHYDSRMCVSLLANFARTGLAILLAASLQKPIPVNAQWSLLEGARVHPDYHGVVPNKSDVVFSTRFKRVEALDIIRAYSATRVEWVYSTDIQFVHSIKGLTHWFGGTLNSNARLPNDDGMAKDFDGNTLIHPRMREWGGKWITTTHPQTKEILQEQATKYVNLGADSIQIDDPLLQLYSAHFWGGDFNNSTLAGFEMYLSNYPDMAELASVGLAEGPVNYREFLKAQYAIQDAKDYRKRYRTLPTHVIWMKYIRQTVREHFKELKSLLGTLRDNSVPLSMNLANLDAPDERNLYFFLAPLADYALAETPIGNTSDLVFRASTFRAMGLGYVPSIKPRSLVENRVAIATLYALGAQPVVPWDVYVGNDGRGQPQRFFGSAEEYADLYRFVRTNSELMDRTEATAVVGIPIPVHKFNGPATKDLVRRLREQRVPFAFILAGGTEDMYKVDQAVISHFKLLVMVNEDSDFGSVDLDALRSAQVMRIEADKVTETMLGSLSPFVCAGSSNRLKLYPRAKIAGENKSLLIHLVDEDGGRSTPKGETCRRRIGIKRNLLGKNNVTSATWNSAETSAKLTLTHGQDEIYVSIPECALWGILAFEFKQ